MKLADIPTWFAKRWGQDATGSHIRTIPATSVDPAAASMSLGFPPDTFVDVSAGGVPPDGRDVNGALNFLSAWSQWAGAGGSVPFNAAIASAGGYPKGARVVSNSDPSLIWVSQVDDNTVNPNSGASANWRPEGVTAQTLSASGYVRLAAGLIVQWGSVTIPGGASVGSASFAFPIAFPNAAFGIVGNPINGANDNYSALTTVFPTLSLTGATVTCDSTNVVENIKAGNSVRWIALGR